MSKLYIYISSSKYTVNEEDVLGGLVFAEITSHSDGGKVAAPTQKVGHSRIINNNNMYYHHYYYTQYNIKNDNTVVVIIIMDNSNYY